MPEPFLSLSLLKERLSRHVLQDLSSQAHADMLPRKVHADYIKKPTEHTRKAGVLILLFEDESRVKFPLIKRATYPGVHSGQMAFPGGRFESADRDLKDTALRETNEEIGVSKEDIEIIGRLSRLYVSASDTVIDPFVGLIHYRPEYIKEDAEVDEIVEMDLNRFVFDNNIVERKIKLQNGVLINAPSFKVERHTVWGATSMVLNELKYILR